MAERVHTVGDAIRALQRFDPDMTVQVYIGRCRNLSGFLPIHSIVQGDESQVIDIEVEDDNRG